MYGDWSIDDNTMYRSLEVLANLKESLQLQVHQAVSEKTGHIAALVFYDVTNYYFETDLNDEDTFDEEGILLSEGLRKRGPSKENRPNPIVQLGLFMDSNGIPICYKLFRGNHIDPITYLPALEEVKKQFGLERMVVVADKAMNSKNNLSENIKNGDGWLFSQKHRGRRGAPKDIQEFILNPEGWEFNEEITFAKKSMIRERKIAKDITCQEKILVTWSKKYANREKLRRDGALDYANNLTNPQLFRMTCKKRRQKIFRIKNERPQDRELKPFTPFIVINEEKVAFDAQFDGINVLVTSEINMSDEEILSRYKELSRIEDCFRITKTEFKARPVYVRKKEHIEAHFLSCFLALIILRILQHRTHWRFSPERMIEALNSATACAIEQGILKK